MTAGGIPALDGIRGRLETARDYPPAGFYNLLDSDAHPVASSALDVPVLLAAVERALEKAGEWAAESRRLSSLGGNPGRAQALEDCAKALRGAVLRALAAESAPPVIRR